MLYGDQAEAGLERITELLREHVALADVPTRRGWDERDVVLITYGDQVQQERVPALVTLREFLQSLQLPELIRIVHILPFFPYSSDDGFSVIDYQAVDPPLGDWDDVQALGESFDLMFDLVLNHISSRSGWFQEYLSGSRDYQGFFIEMDPQEDLSQVVRPRHLPLLTACETAHGTRHVWTTFSADQIDLNFANVDVLCRMLQILLLYVRQGARIIRLDAIAYLWKKPGTSCIHLPQTHTVVKLFRDVLQAVAPHVLLLTETNVPHQENISYFGDGDEAQMVYQFTLPPLMLYTLLAGDARPFMNWLAAVESPPAGTTFLNFTASHDGIGVRPLEGLVSDQQLVWLADQVERRGGLTSARTMPDGTSAPYELNITYYSALADVEDPQSPASVRRFLTSQAIMLSLRGLPAIYFHSLFGTPNDTIGAADSGLARRINRHKFERQELQAWLDDPESVAARVFAAWQTMLSVRQLQAAFHPDASQRVLTDQPPWLVAFWRISLDESQRILILANVSDAAQQLDSPFLDETGFQRDLLHAVALPAAGKITLPPWGAAWLEAE